MMNTFEKDSDNVSTKFGSHGTEYIEDATEKQSLAERETAF
jgi:hypothetical protein